MTAYRTAAFVGVVGGAGATRLTVEAGATLARAGRDVALLDAAFATQGLADYVDGRIYPDVTAVLVDGASGPSFDDALVDLSAGTPGRLAACPAYAPFERIARAKTAAAGERLDALVGELAGEFDHVIVDTPPVTTNPAVASVVAAERVALVAPPSNRGIDALGRARGRLADVGTSADRAVVNRVPDGDEPPDADCTVPVSETADVPSVPTSLGGDPSFASAVARVVESVFETTLELSFEEGLIESARRRFDR